VRKRISLLLLILPFLLSYPLTSSAQRITGTIKGRLTTEEGVPLIGAFVDIESPSLLGMKTYITQKSGSFKFHGLPPGRYKLRAEMPEFKTVTIEDIILRAGMTVSIPLIMEKSIGEETKSLKYSTPIGDVKQATFTSTLDMNILNSAPVARNLNDVLFISPGIIPDDFHKRTHSIIHGSPLRGSVYALDGSSQNDPESMLLLTSINFDLIDEIEIESGAHPVESGPIDGGYVNIITKSGYEKSSAELLFHYTGSEFTSPLRTREEVHQLGANFPPLDLSHLDLSLSAGTPVYANLLCFFGNIRYLTQSSWTSFIPWEDPQGKFHQEYNSSNTEKMGFFKLTSRFLPELRITVSLNYYDKYQPFYKLPLDWNITQEATQILDNSKNYFLNGYLNYTLDQNTSLNLRAGYTQHKLPLMLSENSSNLPFYRDEATGHVWGSALYNEIEIKKRFDTTASLTRFQDTLLGDHELCAGAEYEDSSQECSAWKENNLIVYYLGGSPYYFGLEESPLTQATVGKGLIEFTLVSKEEVGIPQIYRLRRFAVYLRDSITFLDRFTLNLGLRFDRSNANLSAYIKGESGNSLSLKLGEELIKPLANSNPFSRNEFQEWRNVLSWDSLSPRFGLVLDFFGKGKTILKASFSRYNEYLMLEYLKSLDPYFYGRSHRFYWFDENMDEKIDASDSFALYPEDYRLYHPDYWTKRVATDLKSPDINEYTLTLSQVILKEIWVNLGYIRKSQRNILGNVFYSPELERDWYSLNEETKSWWIPFRTIVPAGMGFPETCLTLYFRSKNAPPLFERIKNIPELRRDYEALEISIHKPMSHNWQFLFSAVVNRAKGNADLKNISTGNNNSLVLPYNPNYFINLPPDSSLDHERRFILKIMGNYSFPLGFNLSFFYTHMSGIPWLRTITIVPPESWAEENNVHIDYLNVLLEIPGSRRKDAIYNLDLRIQKELKLRGLGRMALSADIINVLGKKYESLERNDGGYWFPAEENSSQGLRILNPYYNRVTSLSGIRQLRLTLRLTF